MSEKSWTIKILIRASELADEIELRRMIAKKVKAVIRELKKGGN